ncbi:MAG: class I SAM-dependent methyltransferase [Streptosporangiaceae bacterium]
MSEQGVRAAEPWLSTAFARQWTAADEPAALAFPRAIAASVVKLERQDARLIVDIASGPGDFLAVFLEQFPEARGIWTDVSDAMLALARDRLGRFGDRVDYRIADMTNLANADLPEAADAVITSRASHHLNRAGLVGFYQDAAMLLAPGGWMVNLDHVGAPANWDARLRTVRDQLRGAPAGERPGHHHDYPLVGVRDHLDALAAAGLTDAEIPWRSLLSCLFIASYTPIDGAVR